MIKLNFLINREVLNFKIENRQVFYTDRLWRDWVRCLPKDDELIKRITLSRNKFPSVLAKLFNLSKEELEEYNKARTDGEIADIIIKDSKTKGCRLINRREEK